MSHYDAVTAFEMTYFDVIDAVADWYRTNLVQMNVLEMISWDGIHVAVL